MPRSLSLQISRYGVATSCHQGVCLRFSLDCVISRGTSGPELVVPRPVERDGVPIRKHRAAVDYLRDRDVGGRKVNLGWLADQVGRIQLPAPSTG